MTENIKKIFYQDIAEKKKAGTGVYSRTGKGSNKARVAGGVRFAKNNFKPYEKNSRVENINIYDEVVPINTFRTYDKNDQARILQEWMHRFSIEHILKNLGVSHNTLNNMIDNLGVERSNIMRVDKKKMYKYGKGNIQPYQFRLLPNDQKYELVEYYQNNRGMTHKEIADLLGYGEGSIPTMKVKWKKEYIKRKGDNKMSHDDSFLLGISDEKDEEVAEQDYIEEYPDNGQAEDDDIESDNSFCIKWDGKISGSDLRVRLKAIEMMIDENQEYELELMLSERD